MLGAASLRFTFVLACCLRSLPQEVLSAGEGLPGVSTLVLTDRNEFLDRAQDMNSTDDSSAGNSPL